MVAPQIKIPIALPKLQAWEKQLASAGSAMMNRIYRAWVFIVRSYEKERFVRLSRGGGGGVWKPLSPATLRQRRGYKARMRKLKQKGDKGAMAQLRANPSGSILWDTGTLIAVLDPAKKNPPGYLEEIGSFGVRFGFGGPSGHSKAKMTIADLAAFHHYGMGHLPPRSLMDAPGPDVVGKMESVAVAELMSGLGGESAGASAGA